MQHQPSDQAIPGLPRQPVIGRQIVTPLLMVQQRVKGINIHLVTAGYHLYVGSRLVGNAPVPLSVERGRRAYHQHPNVILRGHIHHVRQVKT